MNAPDVKTPTMRPYLPATDNFASGTDSPRAFLERSVAALEAWEPAIGAFVTLNLAAARKAADESTERWRSGKPLSPIDGMPIGVKDIIETIDMPTQNGSPLFAGFRSERDGASVAALREAGAVIVGKTVTTEFAATEPRDTRNPWDTARTPGGSSSGSAAAVAVGAISVGLGTQVLGSILRPASFCRCFGLRPRSAPSIAAAAMMVCLRAFTARSRPVCRRHGKSPTRSRNAPAAIRDFRVSTVRRRRLLLQSRAGSRCWRPTAGPLRRRQPSRRWKEPSQSSRPRAW
jgi:hypothetical protein